MDEWETLERIAAIVREMDATEGYAQIAALIREREKARAESDGLIRGVTAKRVAELRAIVGSQTSVVPREALRDAVHFYDLVRTAWLGMQEEYNELYERLTVVMQEAADLRSVRAP